MTAFFDPDVPRAVRAAGAAPAASMAASEGERNWRRCMGVSGGGSSRLRARVASPAAAVHEKEGTGILGGGAEAPLCVSLWRGQRKTKRRSSGALQNAESRRRSEEHTSEL